MSTLTRVLIIVIFVMSLVYLGISAALFSYRVDYKARLEKETADRKKDVEEKEASILKLKGESADRLKNITTLENNIKTLLVSGGFLFFTERLKPRLGLDCTHANTLEIIDGKLTGRVLGEILDAQGKADWLVKLRDSLGLKPEQVIAMGDGANDLKMFANKRAMLLISSDWTDSQSCSITVSRTV